MKVLLAAINAKYIHSNLGIYSLKAYGEKALQKPDQVTISLAEYTINHRLETILQDIYRRKPDFIGFSCYIWNISQVFALLPDIRKLLPDTLIWLGGPEVSYNGEQILRSHPEVNGVMKGEGEETFAQLLRCYAHNCKDLSRIRGLVYRTGKNPDSFVPGTEQPTGAYTVSDTVVSDTVIADTVIADTGLRPPMDMDRIPFAYETMDMADLAHRIIYYESSRGCPFSCSYCLSSIDKRVRFRSPELVKKELAYFLKAKVPQVKFVDRTFNCRKDHAMTIWQFIRDNDNGVTNFHFEIAADLLDEEEMVLLASMRPGLVQLEIGVQSTNPPTLEAIRRKTDIGEIRRITARINAGHNIHQHLDLIAGLPYEDLERFKQSFNEVYAMEPEQLQLGFLKVLKGSYMEEAAVSWDLVCSANPPYEVLSTRWLSYDDILELKGAEEMVEVYYNSRQFTVTISCLEKQYSTPYEMFQSMAAYYEEHQLTGISHSRLARYEILWQIINEKVSGQQEKEKLRDCLMYDLYLRENVKSRPSFARDQSPYKERIREFFCGEEKTPCYLKDYSGYDAKQMGKMAHVEATEDGALILFDYKNRDPLTYNARAVRIGGNKPVIIYGWRKDII